MSRYVLRVGLVSVMLILLVGNGCDNECLECTVDNECPLFSGEYKGDDISLPYENCDNDLYKYFQAPTFVVNQASSVSNDLRITLVPYSGSFQPQVGLDGSICNTNDTTHPKHYSFFTSKFGGGNLSVSYNLSGSFVELQDMTQQMENVSLSISSEDCTMNGTASIALKEQL